MLTKITGPNHVAAQRSSHCKASRYPGEQRRERRRQRRKPAPRGAGLPSPVSGKTHSMPAHDGLRSDNGYGVKNARTATIEPNEQGTAAGPVQMHPAWRALLQDIELMPQDQDFSFSRWRDLKQSPSMRTKRKAIAIIDRDHVLIRPGPPPRRMTFSEATARSSAGARRSGPASTNARRDRRRERQPAPITSRNRHCSRAKS